LHYFTKLRIVFWYFVGCEILCGKCGTPELMIVFFITDFHGFLNGAYLVAVFFSKVSVLLMSEMSRNGGTGTKIDHINAFL